MADRMRSATAILTLLFLATGCADKQSGSAQAQPAPPVSTTLDRHGAPAVRQPLDVTRFLTDPCATLTPAQLAQLDLPAPGKPDTDSDLAKRVGPSCSWRNSTAASGVAVSYTTANKNGLADLYRGHSEGQFDGYWIPTTVDGYPAVFKDGLDNRKTGNCSLSLGVSDSLALLIDEQDRLGEKSCDRAALIGSMVVATLRGGG